MNETVSKALAREFASLSQEIEAPSAPWGWGEDISCGFDIDLGETVSGTDLLAQSQQRRIDCPKGRLVDDRDWGIDVRGYLNAGTTREEVSALAARVRAELARDDRIATVAVSLTTSAFGDSWNLSIRSKPVDSADTFPLILALTPESIDRILGGGQ